MSKRRDISPDEQQLWKMVVDGVKPLCSDRIKPNLSPTRLRPITPPTPQPFSEFIPAKFRLSQKSLRLNSLKKSVVIEGTIDLHGFTRDQASEALERFMSTSQRLNRHWVLVVTGKGDFGINEESLKLKKGVLQDFVPSWLDQHSHYVVNYINAKPEQGGSGALCVHVRRLR